MKKLILFSILSVLTLSCSSESNSGNATGINPNESLKLVIDGVELNIPHSDNVGSNQGASVVKNGDAFGLAVLYGELSYTDSLFHMFLTIGTNGKLISGGLFFYSSHFNNPTYSNYINYPSHYFQIDNFVVNEAQKRIKINFTGKLYQDEENITSDAREIHGELNMTYIDDGTPQQTLTFNEIEQYCRLNLNGTPWKARFEYTASSFTAEDEYKIETKFSDSPMPSSYSFDSQSTTNYVRFSKFNPVTLVYDYYNVSGQIGYTYREFHGGNNYSFIGTFSFTAVNPNNSADVIQVTNGEFRSYQSL